MIVRRFVLAAMLPGLAAGAAPATAQDVPLANLLPELILREIVLNSPPAGPGVPGVPEGFTHTAHFSPIEAGELHNPVVGIVQSFNAQMATQFATFPLGSSSGGLTYVFDPEVGTLRRSSSSFGPLFGERALTIGRRKLNAGVNYQRTSYDRFEGRRLDDGSIKFYLRHQDCCTVILTPGVAPGFNLVDRPDGSRLNPPFEGDVIEAALSLDGTTHTTAFFANYGVTDRLDVGVAVPIVRVNLDARVNARFIRLVTQAPPGSPAPEAAQRAALDVHTFEPGNPGATRTLRRVGRETGLGDIVVRTKYHALRLAGGGLAVGADLRLPSGDADELLGAGGVQAKFLLIASSERGRWGQHVNVGYTAARGHSAGTFAGLTAAPLPDEINYSGGIELIATSRLTLMADVVGRTLRGTGRLSVTSKAFEYSEPTGFATGTPGVGSCGGLPGNTCRTVSLDEFEPRAGSLHLLLGSAGLKLNPVGNWLISANALFPLTDAGLRSRLAVVAGVDYAF